MLKQVQLLRIPFLFLRNMTTTAKSAFLVPTVDTGYAMPTTTDAVLTTGMAKYYSAPHISSYYLFLFLYIYLDVGDSLQIELVSFVVAFLKA